jgi:hypothetical protein
LYLLHEGTGIVQTADTINFNLSASKLCSDTKAAQANGKFEGYLNDELSNITFNGEQSLAQSTLSQWIKYVDADKKVRSLEYDSKHTEAIAVSVGTSVGQSDYEFSKFDESLGKTIKMIQENFDSSINSAFKTINIFPFILAAFMILVAAACILGIKSRLDEYKALSRIRNL